jgi:hypothetical protein
MRDYKDHGHDTIKTFRPPDGQRYRRPPFTPPGNKGERYYGGYRGSHASLEEEDEEYYDYQDEEEYCEDEWNNISYANQGYNQYTSSPRPCANCKSRYHDVRECDSPRCGTCGRVFKNVHERRVHWFNECREKRSNRTVPVQEQNPQDNKRESPAASSVDRRQHDEKRARRDSPAGRGKTLFLRRSDRNKANSSSSNPQGNAHEDMYAYEEEQEDQPDR